MIYGYARVSSKDQNLDRQLVELKNYGIEAKNIFQDKESGKDFSRVNYQRLRKKLKIGDLLVVKSIDRLGRNYNMIIEEWAYITKKIQCDILVLDMNLLDTRTTQNNLIGKFVSDIVLQILSFVAENERANIKKRQAEGIKLAKEKGIKFGRPRLIITDNIIQVFEDYSRGKICLNEALKKTKLSYGSFYNYYNKFLHNKGNAS